MLNLIEEIIVVHAAHIREGGCWVGPDLWTTNTEVAMDDKTYEYFVHHFHFMASVTW
jgi:hypothetical protein